MKEQNNIEAEEMRQRIGKLSEQDHSYENSVYDIAKKEDEFREELKNEGLGKSAVNKLADIYSDEVLEKHEANKERWIDKLTGLRNRNALNEEVPQLLHMEKRQNNNCSFLLLDLDFFKKVNDELGHPAGDQVLKEIAKIIKSQVRAADIVYRYGGEEIAIFLSNTVSTDAAKLAERIRAAVERSEIEITDAKGEKQYLKKTVSIGCIGTDQLKEWSLNTEKDAGNYLKIIIEDADIALYSAKKSGRNRTIIYDKNLEESADGGK